MIDKDKLRYDLALQAAVVMTLRDIHGSPPDRMLINFDIAYSQYEQEHLVKLLDETAKKINQNGSS